MEILRVSSLAVFQFVIAYMSYDAAIYFGDRSKKVKCALFLLLTLACVYMGTTLSMIALVKIKEAL